MLILGLQIMDIVAGAASISQLTVYSIAAFNALRRLHSALTASHSAYREQEKKIRLLLDITKRLYTHHDIKDSDPVLPILIEISGLACQILHLLQPKQFLGYNWTAFTSQDKVDSAFKTLDRNREILHLCVSLANNNALNAIQTTVEHQTTRPYRDLLVNAMAARANVVSNGNQISGYLDVGNGHAAETMPNIQSSDNVVPVGGTGFISNATQNSEQTVHEIHIRQVAAQHSSTAHMTSPPQTTTNCQSAHRQTLPIGLITAPTSAPRGAIGGIAHLSPEMHKTAAYQFGHKRQQSDTVDSTYGGSEKDDPNEALDC